MQKTFFSNLVLLILLNLLIKPIWILGIDVNVQRILGPDSYGNYFALLNFAFLFSVLMDFGLNNFNNRQVSRNPLRMSEYLAGLGTLKLMLGVVFIVVVQVVAVVVGFSVEQQKLLWGVSAIILLQSILLFIRSNISGIQWFRADVLISVLDKSMAIVLCAILIWGDIDGLGLTIEHFIAVQIIAYVISIVVGLFILLKKAGKLQFKLDLKEAKRMLKGSSYYALLMLLMLSYYKIDAVMIERMLDNGAREAGVYAQAYKLLEASVMFAYLFSTLLMPMFSRMIKKREDVTSLVRLADQLMLVPAAIFAIGASFYGPDLMALLYEEETLRSAKVFPLLILSLIPIGASYIYGTLITAKGDLRTLNWIALVGVLVNVVGNSIMIPTHGIIGAALMTLITQTVVCLSQVVIAHRYFNLPFSLKHFFKVVFLGVGLWVLARIIIELFEDWRVEFVLFLVLAFGLSMVLGLFSFKKLKALVQMRGSIDEV